MIYSAVTLLMLLVAVAKGDTPANCMYEDIRGTWTFGLGDSGQFNAIDCSQFQITSNYVVKLDYPNVASDANGNQGTWTMIYNQGFEVRINNQVFFAFSSYSNTTSYCDQTENGWYHNWDVLNYPNSWGCYVGQKSSSVEPRDFSFLPSSSHEESRKSKKFVNDKEMINHINSVQNYWVAAEYSEFEKYTIGEMEKRAGIYAHEFKQYKSQLLNSVNFPLSEQKANEINQQITDIPSDFDWRNVNNSSYVSPVRDQGQCGSCYAFSSMGALEGRFRVASNNALTPIFSPQEIVSCSAYAQGCEGGFPYLIAGKYAKDFGVIEEECYPYQGIDSKCNIQCQNPQRWRTSDYRYVGGYYGGSTVSQMQKELMANGPYSVSFEVYPDFMNYAGGVYTHQFSKHLGFNPFVLTNHAVLLVGWGETAEGIPYWTIKNSWGTSWGENGFFRILRGYTGEQGGECAIESLPISVDVVLP